MSKLDRGSAIKFCVCIAILLMKKTGRPSPSAAYGIMEPNGKPAIFLECVDRLPIRPIATSVRARSASVGSGGPSGAEDPRPACCWVGTLYSIEDLFSLRCTLPHPLSARFHHNCPMQGRFIQNGVIQALSTFNGVDTIKGGMKPTEV